MKKLEDPSHLALHGAAPAFDRPLYVGRPNIGDARAFQRHCQEILASGWLTNNGPLVQELERRIASRLGIRHCVAVSNGTIALEIAIRALGLSGEVIVPSWTFIATAHSLYWQGISPVFADIDPSTHNLDPNAVLRKITPRTTGIIGVHLWGRPAPVRELQEIADSHGLSLLFDAAHGFGSSFAGTPIGTFGRAEVLSFHATKVFNTIEGGAIVTNDDKVAETARLMRNFGFAGYDNVIHPGTNGKMTEMNAAMGLVNLVELDSFIEANRIRYQIYRQELSGIGGIRFVEYDETHHPTYHYVVLEVDDSIPCGRDGIIAALQAENIMARKYFWPGCHLMSPYRDIYPSARGDLANTEAVSQRVVVLPTGGQMSEDDVRTVAAVIRLAVHS
jgi:dTDP-4-amino-4,6-dideoxygalactose transaminase